MGQTQRIAVVLYTRAGCHLCDDSKALLAKYQGRLSLDITEVDIDEDVDLQARYGSRVPVITIDGTERFWGVVNEPLLVRALKGIR
jgi:glutaredoxin